MAGELSTLTIKHSRASGGVLVRLSGRIDETFDKASFLAGLEGVVIIDLDRVTQVTSFGVREWINALQQLGGLVFFVRCRPALVSQFNMVRGFGGSGKVVTLYMPYVCTACHESFDRLLDLRTEHEVVETLSPPEAECPKCKSAAEFDDLPEGFFSYAAKQPRPQPPPLFESLLVASETPTGGPPLKVEKEISGSLTGIWLSGYLDGKDYLRRAAEGIEGSLMLSMQDITGFSPEGLDRVAAFLAKVSVPTTLVDIPIELADRIALLPDLADKEFGVRTVVADFICVQHAKVTVSVTLSALKTTNPTLLCPQCRQPTKPAFPEALLKSVRLLPPARTNPEEAALLHAHSLAHSEITALKTPSSGQLVAGAVIMGRYRFEKLLGAGGMAEVFLARQTAIGGFEKLVVIKRILPGLAIEASFVDMFLYEARIAARVNHPNVVQIHDVGRDGSQYFIVMEYVNGWDLAVVLRNCLKLGISVPVSVGLTIGRDIFRALSAAHMALDETGKPAPVVHRDVSPHNILVGRDGTSKLTDFGIAKAADCLSVTPTSLVKGKTAYLAPEVIQANMKGSLHPSIDIFAGGIVMYQLLLNVNPYRRDNDVGTLTALLTEHPPFVSELRPGVPVTVSMLVNHLLEKNPMQRASDAAKVADDLEKLLNNYQPQRPEPPISEWLKDLELRAAEAPALSRRDPGELMIVDTATIDPKPRR